MNLLMRHLLTSLLVFGVFACSDDDPDKSNNLINNANNANNTNNVNNANNTNNLNNEVLCSGDDECLADEGCYYDECVALPTEEWACWEDRDCSGTCNDVTWCAYNTPCAAESSPGFCGCAEDSNCDNDEQCYFGAECFEIPTEGDCYEDRDCGEGETCAGATHCPPNVQCVVGTEFGSCQQPG